MTQKWSDGCFPASLHLPGSQTATRRKPRCRWSRVRAGDVCLSYPASEVRNQNSFSWWPLSLFFLLVLFLLIAFNTQLSPTMGQRQCPGTGYLLGWKKRVRGAEKGRIAMFSLDRAAGQGLGVMLGLRWDFLSVIKSCPG